MHAVGQRREAMDAITYLDGICRDNWTRKNVSHCLPFQEGGYVEIIGSTFQPINIRYVSGTGWETFINNHLMLTEVN